VGAIRIHRDRLGTADALSKCQCDSSILATALEDLKLQLILGSPVVRS
jgi:hypothetical protein